ncbi:MAG: esterase-like activity of phytase family protein, partial [Thermomicrobiales bacterium]|nr:esterase-like activity of phytase family protein [Thermomicrobiales bacterium]
MVALRSRLCTGIGSVLIAGSVALTGAADLFAQEPSELLATYTLPDITLAEAQAMALPGFPIADDHGLLLGGVGSDLWHDPAAPADEFWMVTDRGPNGQIKVEEKNRRTFPTAEFTPLIVHVRVADDAIEILETIAIVGQSGAPVTGLSNLEGVDEVPYDHTAQIQLDYNASGL